MKANDVKKNHRLEENTGARTEKSLFSIHTDKSYQVNAYDPCSSYPFGSDMILAFCLLAHRGKYKAFVTSINMMKHKKTCLCAYSQTISTYLNMSFQILLFLSFGQSH